jgi:heme exporter protein D
MLYKNNILFFDNMVLYINIISVILQPKHFTRLEDEGMWNDKKSLNLSKLCILFFMTGLLGTIVSAPWLTRWFLNFSRAELQGAEPFFLATIYVGGMAAGILLYNLFGLLRRIEKEQVFIKDNVEYLRRISWSCFFGAGIGVASAFYYFPWVFVAVAAAFMGLIVRVVKNVLAKAVELQNEVDYTI